MLVFIPKLLARSKRFVSISIEIFFLANEGKYSKVDHSLAENSLSVA